MMKRRAFCKTTASAFTALAASGCVLRPLPDQPFSRAVGYGQLVPDPQGLLDLPEGFSYQVISALGDAMTDGATVPDKADGMGCFDLGEGRLALVRNHELVPSDASGGAFESGFGAKDGVFVPGGTIVAPSAETRPCNGGKGIRFVSQSVASNSACSL